LGKCTLKDTRDLDDSNIFGDRTKDLYSYDVRAPALSDGGMNLAPLLSLLLPVLLAAPG
jgi:hypothetical protein